MSLRMRLPEMLRELELAVVADLVNGELQHAIRAKLQCIVNAAFMIEQQVSRRTDLLETEPSVWRAFALLASSTAAVSEGLAHGHAPPPACQPVAEIAAIFDGLPSFFGREARVEIDCPIGHRTEIDGRELQLATAHLVENALEGRRPGERPHARVTVSASAEVILIEVVDRGVGLPDEVAQRALEPYFSTKPGRLGLGLNVARALARRWRGDLVLEPQPIGARAHLVFPIPATSDHGTQA